MFGIFQKKTELERLQIAYKELMREWHALSNVNRAESDKRYAQAQMVQEKIMLLQNAK